MPIDLNKLASINPPLDLMQMYKECNEKYFNNRLSKNVTVKWSKQLRSCAGNCCPSTKTIKISTLYYRAFPEDIINVLIHEMIHLEEFSHGEKFQKEMNRINKMDSSLQISLVTQQSSIAYFVEKGMGTV